eukprot:5069907-Pyramimonas_sp.AAC.1
MAASLAACSSSRCAGAAGRRACVVQIASHLGVARSFGSAARASSPPSMVTIKSSISIFAVPSAIARAPPIPVALL